MQFLGTENIEIQDFDFREQGNRDLFQGNRYPLLCEGLMSLYFAEQVTIELLFQDFLDSMATLTGGKLMTTADAKLMSRSYIHHV